MNFLTKILVKTLAVILVSYFMPGVQVKNITTAIVVAVVLAFLDSIVKPIMIVLTIPVKIFSLGLFLLVINACLVLLADYFVEDFYVKGFFTALFFSIILSLTTSILEAIAKPSKDND
jgi:putative membrane protein